MDGSARRLCFNSGSGIVPVVGYKYRTMSSSGSPTSRTATAVDAVDAVDGSGFSCRYQGEAELAARQESFFCEAPGISLHQG